MIVDTDILIWYMRGNAKAQKLLDAENSFNISVVSYMELVQGLRNKAELHELRKALNSWHATTFYINEEISAKASFLVERFYLSHSLALADALILSTALVHGQCLLTGNDKHYSFVREVEIRKFRP